MNKNSTLEYMVACEKDFKNKYISNIESTVRKEIAEIFFNNHRIPYDNFSEEDFVEEDKVPFSSVDYKFLSDFLNEKVVQFSKNNTNVFKLLKDNVMNDYATRSNNFLKTINEELILECRIITRGSARFFAYDSLVMKSFQNTINKMRNETFKSFLHSDEEILKNWKRTRFLTL